MSNGLKSVKTKTIKVKIMICPNCKKIIDVTDSNIKSKYYPFGICNRCEKSFESKDLIFEEHECIIKKSEDK